MKTKIITLLFIFIILGVRIIFAQSDYTLWYNQPVKYFEESLVLGNGRVGACVFGGVNSDKIFLNDVTLWSGEPINPDMNKEAYKYIPIIRETLRKEKYKEADSINHFVQGSFSQSYAPLGSMFIDFDHKESTQKYYRELNINEAVSKVTYEINGVGFTREYFISNPDKVMVIKLTSGIKGALNFDIKFKSLLKYKVVINSDV